MRSLLFRNGLQLAGVGSVFAGLWMVFPPAALIVTGVAVVLWERGLNDDAIDDR